MAKKPAEQWYPGDWAKDAAVQALSLAARGAWFEMVNHMMAANGDRVKGTPEQLTRLCNCSENELLEAVAEMVSCGTADVFASDPNQSGRPVKLEDPQCIYGWTKADSPPKVLTLVCRRFSRMSSKRKLWRNQKKRQRSNHVRQDSAECPPQCPSPSSSSTSVLLSSTVANAPPSAPISEGRKRLVDVLAERCYRGVEIPRSEWGRIGKAAKELEGDGVDAAELDRLSEVHERCWPNATMTPSSLAKNVATLRRLAGEGGGESDYELVLRRVREGVL